MNNELGMMNTGGRIVYFTDLNAWKEAHKLVLEVYKITKKFPQEELFALTSQMRRAAVSITSNIAEGFSRRSYKEKSNFYAMAQGSLTELKNQFFIARDISYISGSEFQKSTEQATLVHRLLQGIIRKSKTFLES